MSAWCWLALVPPGEDAPADADAHAAATELDGTDAGRLAIWTRRGRPRAYARRADARILDPEGEPVLVSLVRPPDRVQLAFDDLAVQQARRDVLAGPPPALVTSLLRDASHFEGALTARRGDRAHSLLRDDPFARVFPARILRVAAGLLGAVPAPAGPVIERYGSAKPWPLDRWDAR